MSFLSFFEQLSESPWSVALHESEIAYSLIESFHVWSLCLFFGMTVMFDLRLLGWTMRKVPVSEVIRRLQPWTIVGFVLMVITGTLLFYAIPLRSYQNIFFRTKMLLLLLAGVNILFFQWCYSTPIGEGIRNSTWLFPVIEAFHLLGLGLTAGAVLVVDFRLLGVGLRKQSAAQLWANTQPWLLGSVTLMFASGDGNG